MSEIVWINATDAAVDEALGIVTVKLPYTVKPSLTKMATLKEALTFVPADLTELGLPLLKRNLKERPDCGYDVTFDCEGHFKPESADGEEFTLDGASSDDAIESHPEIERLVQKYFPEGTTLQQARKEDGSILFPITLQVNGKDVPNPLFGIKTYLVPGLVWTRTFTTQFLPDDLARQLGCIGNPPVGKKGQRVPTLAGQRDWIMVRMRADWRGNIWKCSESWLVSGPNGATPDIYRYR
jgi:hypothetical protein